MQPLLYEVNARQWLGALARRREQRVDLATVPDDELDRLAGLGVTHLWTMGVWPSGARARREALQHGELRRAYDEALPGWSDADVVGSPYAVASYAVAADLGGDEALARLRARLAARHIRLMVDFVPNHLGVDHAWVTARPELFVHAHAPAPDTFAHEHEGSVRFMAHGRDPYFPGWTDTAQLDYRRADTRAAMQEQLLDVAARCDGVRCDMSMLVLEDVFARTWGHMPLDPDVVRAEGEFWADAISAVRARHPQFVFLAEAYWDLEARLCALGFDYAYDKKLLDLLVHERHDALQPHLLGLGRHNEKRAHFLENHDERRAAVAVPRALHEAAAVLVLGLPGMRLLHDGELEGRRRFARVQLGRRAEEPPDVKMSAMYAKLLADVGESAIGRGEGRVLAPRQAAPGNESFRSIILVQWQRREQGHQVDRFDLVVVNASPDRAQCWAPLEVPGLAGAMWALADRRSLERWERDGDALRDHGLYLDVAPRAAQIFAFRRQ